jgi:hypothetical protein
MLQMQATWQTQVMRQMQVTWLTQVMQPMQATWPTQVMSQTHSTTATATWPGLVMGIATPQTIRSSVFTMVVTAVKAPA